ncbi:MAG: tetratricopeptide repeat protein, partial [Okeania sp. SIO3C4]|nr:tetratricopeptide repeat protein [Okeania sp. SIO3C4]
MLAKIYISLKKIKDMLSSIEKDSVVALIKQGNTLKREGKLEEAAATYRRCIEVNPTSGWSYNNLGEVLFKLGELDEAILAYHEAIKLNPNSAWFYHNLALALVKKGSAESITYSRRACELNPNCYEFYKVLAWSLKKRRKWNEAITAYTKVIELNPNDSQAYYCLGDIFKTQRRWQNAIEICQKGLAKIPESEELANQLQKLIKNQNNAQKQSQIKNQIYHYRKIAAEQKEAGNLDEAIAAYQQGIKLQPNNSDYWQLGMLLVEKQKWEESILCYEKLLELKPWQKEQIEQCLSLGELLVNQNKL